MYQRSLLLCAFIFTALSIYAQSGCPGCVTQLPAGLPADTIYLPTLPDGVQGTAYNHDGSFRMPKTTTPVAAVDSSTPPGLTITKMEILAVEGLPPGLYWQPSQFVFEVANETDGCIKICGTPTVADSFTLTVRVKATVLFITKEATFPLHLYIAPKVSNTDGFSITNFTGCDSTTVAFTNNIPSNGMPGFQYHWDFGDSTMFDGENPPPHTYHGAGIYPIRYQAIIDTSGYILESVTVQAVECVDQLGVGTPDLYIHVESPSGPLLFDSWPYVDNTSLPYTFPVGLVLGSGNYTLRVFDEDGGLKGGDDACGVMTFNTLSNGVAIAGGLQVILNIVHPIDTLTATDTVRILPLPVSPVYNVYHNQLRLTDTINLPAQYSLQWYSGNNPIPGETGFTYCAQIEGYYGLLITDLTTGCTNFYTSFVPTSQQFNCTTTTTAPTRLPFRVLPNPATNAVVIQLDNSLTNNGLIRAWDITGRLLLTQGLSAGTNNLPLDCSAWPNGIYLLEIQSGSFRGLRKLVVSY